MNFIAGAIALLTSMTQTVPAMADPIRLAQPTEGYTYFNKPGATSEFHKAEIESCLLDARAVVSWDEKINNNKSLMAQLMLFGRARAARLGGLENCMIVRGWRTVSLEETLGRPLSTLSSIDLEKKLSEWVGATQPQGTIRRVWKNDALDAANKRAELVPSATMNGSLSLLILGKIDDLLFDDLSAYETEMQERFTLARAQEARLARPMPASANMVISPEAERLVTRNLRLQDLSALPAGWGVILVRLKNPSMQNGSFIGFGPNNEAEQSLSRKRFANKPTFGSTMLGGRGENGWQMRAVPAGAYRIDSLGAMPLGFCLGAPSFNVAAGTIVYVGTFDFAASSLGPNLTLLEVQTYITDQAVLAKVQVADYQNGSVANCLGNTAIYALEFPSFPFVAGYAWGSRAANIAPAVTTPTDKAKEESPTR